MNIQRQVGLRSFLVVLVAAIGAMSADASAGEKGSERQSVNASEQEYLATDVTELADVVLDKHIDPPTRQQMLLAGVKAVYRFTGKAVPHGLARRVSQLGDEQATSTFVREVLEQSIKSAKAESDVGAVMMRGMLSAATGSGLIAASEYRVNRQLSENRYEGIGIALGRDEKSGLPVIQQAFPGGPARLAGAKEKDRILSVDGIDMKGKSIRDYLDVLRGKRGEPVSIVVQQPSSNEKRTLDMVRGVIPFETVVGRRRINDERWDFRAKKDSDVAYVKIASIRGSTASEIRQISRKLRTDGFRAAILDLRETSSAADVHHTVMLADALLDGGPIGKVQFADKQQSFDARDQCAFRDMPLAVLTDQTTRRDAEWLAAALQDRARAIVIGEESAGQGVTESSIALSNGNAVTMPTGIFLRADGRQLVGNRRPFEAHLHGQIPIPVRGASQPSRGGVVPEISVVTPRRPGGQLVAIKKAVEVLKEKLAKLD